MKPGRALILAVTLGMPAASASQEVPAPLGRTLDFTFTDATSLRGELLAVGTDTIWILASAHRVQAVALRAVSRVRTRRSGMTAAGILIWATIGGLASGGALTAACSSVEGAECAAVFPAAVAAWLLVGGVAAGITGSGQQPLPTTTYALRPYARFPQGLPPGFPMTAPRAVAPMLGDSAASLSRRK